MSVVLRICLANTVNAYGAPKGTHVEEKIKVNRAHDL